MIDVNMECLHLKTEIQILTDVALILKKKIATQNSTADGCGFSVKEMELLDKLKTAPGIGHGMIFHLIMQLKSIQESEYNYLVERYKGHEVLSQMHQQLLATQCFDKNSLYKYYRDPRFVFTGEQYMQTLVDEIKYRVGKLSLAYGQHLQSKDFMTYSHPVEHAMVAGEIRPVAHHNPLVY